MIKMMDALRKFYAIFLSIGIYNFITALLLPFIFKAWIFVILYHFIGFFSLCSCPPHVNHNACYENTFWLPLYGAIFIIFVGIESLMLYRRKSYVVAQNSAFQFSHEVFYIPYIAARNAPMLLIWLMSLIEKENHSVIFVYGCLFLGLVWAVKKYLPSIPYPGDITLGAWYACYFVVALIFSPLIAGACSCRSGYQFVRQNMRTMQVTLERYAQDHQGKYPPNAQVLFQDATKNGYWQKFTNPYANIEESWGTYLHGQDQTVSFLSSPIFYSSSYFIGIHLLSEVTRTSNPTQHCRGLVLVQFKPNSYSIYGCFLNGNFITASGKYWILTPANK